MAKPFMYKRPSSDTFELDGLYYYLASRRYMDTAVKAQSLFGHQWVKFKLKKSDLVEGEKEI